MRSAAKLSIVTGSARTLSLPTHAIRRGTSPIDFSIVPRAVRWEIARALTYALQSGRSGVGLAAPMTGLGIRAVVSTAASAPIVMFNPRIVATSGPILSAMEANLSLPGLTAKVPRNLSTTVRWQLADSGEEVTATFEGTQARVLAHEIEILDGVLFVDHAASAPTDAWMTDDERAQRAFAAVAGGDTSARHQSETLSLATIPPSMLALNGVLARPSDDVDLDTMDGGHLRALVREMFRVMYRARGVGLAAPQVGLGLRLAVIDSGIAPPSVLINPEVIDRDGDSETEAEGCLSLPGVRGAVTRDTRIKVRTKTLTGDSVEVEFAGYQARIAQHEIDHLDGVLYPNRMDRSEKLASTDAGDIADSLTQEMKRQESRYSTASRSGSAGAKGAQSRNKRRRR